MDINKINLCPSCFTLIESEPCKICGYAKETVNQHPTALPFGTILAGKYMTGRVLGKGGFGITYLAYDLIQSKRVAIKEYLPDNLTHRNTGMTEVSIYTGEKEETFKRGAEKFYEEARTVYQFNGKANIINVFEFFYENNTAYFVMEYLNGIDLKGYVANNGGSLPEERIIELVLPVLDALKVIHSAGILHRDISPDNIYICDDGNVKILDFGAARQVLVEESKSLSVVLKQGYAPIEQYQTKGKQGQWTDLYALGATMYYCLTGMPPENAMDRVTGVTLKPPSTLGFKISVDFERILIKALALKSIDRYQSAEEFKADIAVLANGLNKEKDIKEDSLNSNINIDSRLADNLKEVAVNIENNVKGTEGLDISTGKGRVKSKYKRLAVLASIIILGLLVGITGIISYKAFTAQKNKVFTCNDKGLEKAIRKALKKKSGDIIYNNDLKKIRKLNAVDCNITDISALEGLQNLTELNLGDNKITDISVLKGFSNLNELDLEENKITDISALKGLSNLKKLDLDENKITDISALKGLSNLKELDLSGNKITNITALVGFSKLTKLSLRGNKITDISDLEGFSNLTVLYLEDNEITDISVLSELTNLEYLNFSGNKITDISALKGLLKLTALGLGVNNITDISALKRLSKLTVLVLGGNKITDISILKNELTNLEYLNLSENKITDISVLKELTKLTDLRLDRNNITDISALKGLRKLEYLYLDDNKITDISVLKELTKLTDLRLNRNNITDISALKELRKLEYLYLDDNKITDYLPVKGYYNNLTEKDFTIE